MRKHSRTQSPNGAAAAATAASDSTPIDAALQAKKPALAARKPTRKSVSKKTRAKKAASPKRFRTTKKAGPSEADIRLRAYFIAERRVQLALQGDPSKDWLEARQQLLAEAHDARLDAVG